MCRSKEKESQFCSLTSFTEISFRAAFSLLFPPRAFEKMKNIILYRERERGGKKTQTEWMGKLNWKHILLGIWSMKLIMNFLLETSSFSLHSILPLFLWFASFMKIKLYSSDRAFSIHIEILEDDTSNIYYSSSHHPFKNQEKFLFAYD